ncbi:hypothetical protein ACU4GD_32420 [Cupriavidus basilensis]
MTKPWPTELCARCCFEQDLEALAMAYLRRASDAYGRWGADGQVDKLEACARTFDTTGLGTVSATPDRSHAATTQPATYIGPAARLDLDTAIKATQVLAGEMQLDRLIEALLTTTLQQAAAQARAAVPLAGRHAAAGRAGTHRADEASRSISNPPGLPIRTVVDAALATRLGCSYSTMPSRMPGLARTPMCNCAACARWPAWRWSSRASWWGCSTWRTTLRMRCFTGRRINLLSLLASQAAISLENARLYAELLRQNQERQRRCRPSWRTCHA